MEDKPNKNNTKMVNKTGLNRAVSAMGLVPNIYRLEGQFLERMVGIVHWFHSYFDSCWNICEFPGIVIPL